MWIEAAIVVGALAVAAEPERSAERERDAQRERDTAAQPGAPAAAMPVAGVGLRPGTIAPGNYRMRIWSSEDFANTDFSTRASSAVVEIALGAHGEAVVRSEGHGYVAIPKGPSRPNGPMEMRLAIHQRFRGRWKATADGATAALALMDEGDPPRKDDHGEPIVDLALTLHRARGPAGAMIAVRVQVDYGEFPRIVTDGGQAPPYWLFFASGRGLCLQATKKADAPRSTVVLSAPRGEKAVDRDDACSDP